MKILKISTLILGLALTLTPVLTNALPNDSSPTEWIKEKITWVADVMDMGEIPQGTPKEVVFEFTNTSNAPIVVKTVKASCGCTATDYSKNAIAPGAKGFVKAKYNAKKLGSFTKSVTVITSESNSPKRLTIKGKVVAAS